MRLGDFSTLTFDCYGTLIDWETGIRAAFAPTLGRTGADPGPDRVIQAFGRAESTQQEATPGMLYPELLAEVHRRMCGDLDIPPNDGEAAAFGASVAHWPAFPDSAEALAYLARYYRLVVLSNVDRASFAHSNARLGVTFDAVYTAEDIGSYKPNPRNFEYMLAKLGEWEIGPAQVLHTAESPHHDHVPARAFGLATCWIYRRAGQGATASGRAGVEIETDFRFATLANMAAAHRAERG